MSTLSAMAAITSVHDRGVNDALQLATEIECSRRDQLRHEYDAHVFLGIDPEDRRSRAAPVIVALAHLSRLRRSCGGSKAETEADALGSCLGESIDGHFCERLAIFEMVHVHHRHRARTEDANAIELAATA